ncbi:MAG TPA: hypothetical protein VJN64_13015 [Terriglobales bacterium]|nr:hypothetical protein [Terriglobales bacterium]
MPETLDRAGAQQPSASGAGESWWVLTDIFGEFIPEAVWWLALALLVICAVAVLIRKVVESFGGA